MKSTTNDYTSVRWCDAITYGDGEALHFLDVGKGQLWGNGVTVAGGHTVILATSTHSPYSRFHGCTARSSDHKFISRFVLQGLLSPRFEILGKMYDSTELSLPFHHAS